MSMNDPAPVFRYKAVYRSAYDGDTVRFDISLGFGIWLHNQSVRLLGVDTPELRGGTVETKEAGLKARDFVRAALDKTDIVLETYKDEKGKYGRWLAVVWFKDNAGKWDSLNSLLLTEGLAKEYGK